MSLPLTCGNMVAERRDLMVATYSLLCGTGASDRRRLHWHALHPGPAGAAGFFLAARGCKACKNNHSQNASQRSGPHFVAHTFN